MLFLNNPQIDAECGNLYIGEVRFNMNMSLLRLFGFQW